MPVNQRENIASDFSEIVQVENSGTPIIVDATGVLNSTYSPDPSTTPQGTNDLSFDAAGRLETHSTITTDEGSFRDDFTGASLTNALTGTLGFTNGSLSVIGTGTSFTTQIKQYQYIKKSTDAETLFVQVASVNSDTSLTLVSAYAGTTASVASVVSKWLTTTGSGGSFSVASSQVNILSGITSGAKTFLSTPGDYLPYTLRFYASLSQRIANQNATMGFADSILAPGMSAYIQFTGTSNTQVNLISSASTAVADIQTTVVTLPGGALTSGLNLYQLDLSANQVTLSINGQVVAVNSIHMPGPYDNLLIFAGWNNSGVPASTSTLTIDFAYFTNWDRLQIDNDFQGEPLKIVTQDSFGSGTISAVAGVVVAPVNGAASVTFNVQGTFVGTMVAEAIDTDGTIWNQIQGLVSVNNSITAFVGGDTAMIINCGGFNQVRLRAIVWTSGTANVSYQSGVGNNIIQAYSLLAANFMATAYLKDSAGNNTLSVNSQLNTRDVLTTGGQYRAVSVTATVQEALGAATILTNRKSLQIQPTNGVIYWGYSNTVSSTTGMPIASGQTVSFNATEAVHIYIVSAGTVNARIMEGA